MRIIGCDYHPGFQQIAFVDTETGECGEQRLQHPEEAEKFYRELAAQGVKARVGMEASGHARWFERLLSELSRRTARGRAQIISELDCPAWRLAVLFTAGGSLPGFHSFPGVSRMFFKQAFYLTLGGLGSAAGGTGQSAPALPAPAPAHVVVVMEENHGYSQIIGSSQAPYVNTLASQGALFTQSFAVAHPSEPNYLDLFSGSNQGVTGDSCPHTFSTPTLESELIAAKKTFKGYSEGLPATGSKTCRSGKYARKHVPWTDFSRDLVANNVPFTSFPTDFSKLPTVAWVIPNLDDDMHDGSIQQGDSWLQANLLAYVIWARTHNSLLIVTFDEDQGTTANHITTIFVGPMVKPGKYSEKISHYNVLRTVEDIYGLPHLRNAGTAKSINDVWK